MKRRDENTENKVKRRGGSNRGGSYVREDVEQDIPSNLLTGRNPVMEALKKGRGIDKIMIAKGTEGSVVKIAAMASDAGVEVQYVQRSAIDRIAYGLPHQGVAAFVSDYEYSSVDEILDYAEEKNEDPFVVILDGIEDPHNLGAIIRTADAAGAHGIIIQKRRAVSITPVVEKSAAGAAEYVKVARVANITQAITSLQKRGLWIAAVDMDGECCWKTNLSGPIAVVIGSEGRGISRLVKETCDFVVSMPMLGCVNSLNASNAAALVMYEIVRQRTGKE